jgi:hypothetical protein
VSAPTGGPAAGTVVSVGSDDAHRFSKPVRARIELVAGHGVAGDTHAGATVRRRVRGRGTVEQPNLRQVHLLSVELLDRFGGLGFTVEPGDLGENVLLAGIDLHALPTGARLHLGPTATVELTGLRNPCRQMDDFQDGLVRAAFDLDEDGTKRRRVGVLAVVTVSGEVAAGDPVSVEVPTGQAAPLEVV